MWCPMVERRWDPIRYTSFRSHRHSGGGMGFPKSTKMQNTTSWETQQFFFYKKVGHQTTFFAFVFSGLFWISFFFALKSLRPWEPGKISPMFSSKN